MPSNPAIKTSKLTKRFGDFVAVDGIDIEIMPGEIFGILGPNGSGKTTLISMFSMLTSPSSGTAKIVGLDIIKNQDAVRNSIGVVFQDPSLDDRLTGRENLEFHAMLYGIERKTMAKRIDEVLEIVELKDRSDSLVRTYSGGMRRRLEIARGLIQYPKVLFLDEPTLGLDPQTRDHIWEYIRKLAKQENITIVLTTHYMEEADILCNRIAVIDKGKIIALGTPKDLKSIIGSETISIKVENGDYPGVKEKVLKAFPKSKGFDGKFVVYVKNAERSIRKVFEDANKAGIDIVEASVHKPTLNDVFLHLTGKEMRDEKVGSMENVRLSGIHRRR